MNDRKILKASVIYVGANVFTTAFSLISGPIFARLLSVDIYGQVSNFQSWANLLSLVFLGLSYSISVAYVDYKERFNKFLSSLYALYCLIGIIIVVVILFARNVFNILTGFDWQIVEFIIVFTFANQIVTCMLAKYRFDYSLKAIVFITLYQTFTIFLLSLLCVLLMEDDFIGRIIGLCVPIILLAIFSLVSTFRNEKTYYEKEYWLYALKIAIPMIPHGISMSILAQMDRTMINNIRGSYYTGIYSMGYNLATMISIIINSVNSAISPWLYENIKDKNYAAVRKKLNTVSWIVVIASCGLVLITPEAITYLGGAKYKESVYVVAPVVSGTILQFYYNNYSIVEMLYKKTYLISIASVVAAISNYILNLILISKYGYIAAAYTTLICYGILMIMHGLFSRMIIKTEIYDFLQMVGCLFVGIVVNGLFMLLFDRTIIRYILIIVLLYIFTKTGLPFLRILKKEKNINGSRGD